MGLMSSKSNVGMAREDIPSKGNMSALPLDWPIVVLRCERTLDNKCLDSILPAYYVRCD